MSTVDGVQEEESGVACCPGSLSKLVKDYTRVQSLYRLAGCWMMEFIAFVEFHSTHEGIGDADGQIEIREDACRPLRIEKASISG